MRGDFVTDDSRTNILFIWKAKVFFCCHVAEHRRSVPSNLSGAYCAGDVIVAGAMLVNQRTQGIEGSLETVPELFVSVLPNALHRDMPGTLNHHLYVMLPGARRQFSQRAQFRELRFVVGVVD
jgi:hypothetical protein